MYSWLLFFTTCILWTPIPNTQKRVFSLLRESFRLLVSWQEGKQGFINGDSLLILPSACDDPGSFWLYAFILDISVLITWSQTFPFRYILSQWVFHKTKLMQKRGKVLWEIYKIVKTTLNLGVLHRNWRTWTLWMECYGQCWLESKQRTIGNVEIS